MIRPLIRSLPAYYDQSIAASFAQGPDVLFVYWELSAGQWEVAAGSRGSVVIRMYQVLENAADGFDCNYTLVEEVEPPPATGNWYFKGLEAGSVYSFEVGFRLPDGSFFSLLQSEKTATPPNPGSDAGKRGGIAGGKPRPHQLEATPAGGREKIVVELELAEVLEKMPFYMGFDPGLAG